MQEYQLGVGHVAVTELRRTRSLPSIQLGRTAWFTRHWLLHLAGYMRHMVATAVGLGNVIPTRNM